MEPGEAAERHHLRATLQCPVSPCQPPTISRIIAEVQGGVEGSSRPSGRTVHRRAGPRFGTLANRLRGRGEARERDSKDPKRS